MVSSTFVPQFVKYLTNDDCSSNEMCFNVYIIGNHGSEINYPSIVEGSQNCNPEIGGWKFVQHVYSTKEIVDEVVPPMSFLSKFGSRMPARVKYVLHNGKKFNGYYLRNEQTLRGLGGICDSLQLQNLNAFDLLVFTFDVFHSFTVSCFDGRNVETVIDDRLVSSGEFGESLFPPFEFVVDVQRFHMLNYSYRVKRPDWKRTTIHDGWLPFRDDLGLNIGDQCIFKWKDRSYNHFIVEVVKAVGVAP
ncbi:hypothetical protein POM88_037029 [Heracleum sosnowskyi]|uniref:TF-B3 domain-containing protein n=1 Tax=Heracleum sosnowskyi TaxID=360622 RepID=A0AAD8MFH5_9APIA|nr:hypothetical protein POM88_037029 [Heracleum sosnowskyi]